MWASESANYSWDHMLGILDCIILPGIGVVDAYGKANVNTGFILVDKLKGRARNIVKDRIAQLEKVYFYIISEGITPKARPLDVLVNKFFKEFY